jgi:hypothetical protein
MMVSTDSKEPLASESEVERLQDASKMMEPKVKSEKVFMSIVLILIA